MDGNSLKFWRRLRLVPEHTHRWRQVGDSTLYECAEPRCTEVGFWVPKRTDG